MMLVKFYFIFILIDMKYVTSEYVAGSSEKYDIPTEIEVEATNPEIKNTESGLDFPEELLKIISKSKPIGVPNTDPIIPKVDDPKDKIQKYLKNHKDRIFDNTEVSSIDTEIKPKAPKISDIKSAESELDNINNDKSEYVVMQSKKSKQITLNNNHNEHKNHRVRLLNNINSRRRPVFEESMSSKNDKFPRPCKTLKIESMLPTTWEEHPKPNNILKRLVHTLPELKDLNLDTKKIFIPKYLKVQSNKDDELTFSVMNSQREIEFEPKNVIFADAIELDAFDIPSIGINQRRLRRNVDEPSQMNEADNTMTENKNSSIKENTIVFFKTEASSTNKDKSNINVTSTSASLDPESTQNRRTENNSETRNLSDVGVTIYKNASTKGVSLKTVGIESITTSSHRTSDLSEPQNDQNSKLENTLEKRNQTSVPNSVQSSSMITSKAPNSNFEIKTSTVSKPPTFKTSAVTKSSKNYFEDVLQPINILSGVNSSRDHVKKSILKTWRRAKDFADGTVDAANNFFGFFSNSADSIASSLLG